MEKEVTLESNPHKTSHISGHRFAWWFYSLFWSTNSYPGKNCWLQHPQRLVWDADRVTKSRQRNVTPCLVMPGVETTTTNLRDAGKTQSSSCSVSGCATCSSWGCILRTLSHCIEMMQCLWTYCTTIRKGSGDGRDTGAVRNVKMEKSTVSKLMSYFKYEHVPPSPVK